MNPIVLEGKEMGLGVVRSLGMMNVKSFLVYNNDEEIARVSKYVAGAYRCPEWSDQKAVKNFLIKNANELKGGMLIPTNDQQTEILSQHKKELSEYYTVPVPDIDIVKKFLDKKETYRVAAAAGIDFPLTFYPNSEKEALQIAQDMKFPLMIKPRKREKFLSVFNKKLFIIDNENELRKKLKTCFEQKIQIMITEIISGSDDSLYEYDFYIDKKGELLAGLGHVKVRQAPPNFGFGRVLKIAINRDVEELTKKFLKYMPGFFGPGQLEFKLDARDKKYKIIEMNGRITQQNYFFSKAGINFAYIYYQEWANNHKIKLSSFKKDLYYINLFYDLMYSLLKHTEENYGLYDYIKPYMKKKVYGIESMDDPKPMVFYWSQKFKNIPALLKEKYLKGEM
jgi:predicted ATP-grasp superfamily ATP-dependent carboligase